MARIRLSLRREPTVSITSVMQVVLRFCGGGGVTENNKRQSQRKEASLFSRE